MIKGIDVSAWNGNINWSATKSDIDFAIIRAGFGREVEQKDTEFENNYKGCKENDIPVGAYWYSYALTPEEAVIEAKACIEILKDKEFELPIFYDIEEKETLKQGQQKVSDIADAFCEELQNAGFKVGIYSFYSALKDSFTSYIKRKYDVWVAHVRNNGKALESTDYTGHSIWQYSWKGRVKGIKGDVDLDYCYKTYFAAKEETVIEEKVEPVIPPQKQDEKELEAPSVFYSSYIGKWLGTIENYNEIDGNGFSGLKGRNISGLSIKSSRGYVRYRVHTLNGKWLNWMETFNQNDWKNGVAGIQGHIIDGIQAELIGVDGYEIQYRSSINGRNDYLCWITGAGKGDLGYSGVYGNAINRVQMRIVKK